MRHTEFFADRPVKPRYRPIIEDPVTVGLPSTAARVTIEVLSLLIDDTDPRYLCAPSKASMARYLRRSPKAIRGAFVELENRSLIRRTGRSRGAGRAEYEVRPEWLALGQDDDGQVGTMCPPWVGTSCQAKIILTESENQEITGPGTKNASDEGGHNVLPQGGTMCQPMGQTASPSTSCHPGRHDVPTQVGTSCPPIQCTEIIQAAARARGGAHTREGGDHDPADTPPPPPIDTRRKTDGPTTHRAILSHLGSGAFDEALAALYDTHRRALFADGDADAIQLPSDLGRLELFCSLAAAMKAELRDDERDDVRSIRGLTSAIYRGMTREPGEALDAVRAWIAKRGGRSRDAKHGRASAQRIAQALARPSLPRYRDAARDGPDAGLMPWIESHAPEVARWLDCVETEGGELAEWLSRLRSRYGDQVAQAGLPQRAHHQRRRFVDAVAQMVAEVAPGKSMLRAVTLGANKEAA